MPTLLHLERGIGNGAARETCRSIADEVNYIWTGCGQRMHCITKLHSGGLQRMSLSLTCNRIFIENINRTHY